MELANNTETKEVLVTPDIKVKKHPKSKIIKKIYYIVFVVVFLFGFIAGSGSEYHDGSVVNKPYDKQDGTYIPAHEEIYSGWYFFSFTYEGYVWEDNPFYIMGMDDLTGFWERSKETYPVNIALFIIFNALLAAAPFIFELIRKKECKNTELNIKEDRIYGSSGHALIKKKIDIPLKSINNITILESKADKIKSGKTIEILYGTKKEKFSYIHNAEAVKNYINECISKLKSKKEETVQTTVIQNDSMADELKKFKDLLDSGVITQEEFDAKKKQILGL